MVGELLTVKRGSGVRDQGVYAEELNVGPEIINIFDDGYTMKTEDQMNVFRCPLTTLQRMQDRLSTLAWSRRVPMRDWKTPFMEWSMRQVFNPAHMMLALYCPYGEVEHVMIHGDPTLSNVVYSKNNRVLLIDPIRPTGKIPGLVEVDLGKMLQSVVGWEHVMFGWPEPETYVTAGFIARMAEERLLRSMFWLGVHALRILPYAESSPVATEWATGVARIIFRDLERRGPCVTLTTLMEHSLTLAKRCC